MTEPVNPELLKLTADGEVCLQPCRQIVFYWCGSAFDRSTAIVAFYRRSLALLQGRATFYRTETMRRAKRIDAQTWDMLPFWFKTTSSRRSIYQLRLESGVHADEPSDCAFAITAHETGAQSKGFIRLVLPLAMATEPDGAFAQLAIELSEGGRYAFGQAGYSVNWNDLGDYQVEAMNGMRRIAFRHPGIDLASPATTMYAVCGGGIKGVDWLTFIDRGGAAKCGERAGLVRLLPSDVVVHALSDGLAIQAGTAPAIGDVNRGEELPIYRQVGRVLAKLRAKSHPAFLGKDGLPSADMTNRWLARFDR